MIRHRERSSPRRQQRAITSAAVALTLVVAGCTSAGDDATVTVTVPAATATTPGGAQTSSAATQTTSSEPPSETSSPAPSNPPQSSGQEPTITTPAPTTPSRQPGPTIKTVPATSATGVSPIAPVVVKAAAGALIDVALLTPEKRLVSGSFSADNRTWTSQEPLGYNRSYTLEAAAEDDTGVRTTTTTFTTLKPKQTIFPSFFPNPKMKKVGVGQPMVVIFDKPPADRAAAEKALTVKTVPKVQGAWYWWDNRTLHYRPKDYWAPGTKITVTAKIYGIDLGGGAYGKTDRTLNVTIGDSKIAKIDDATKQMNVYINDKLVRTVPVSMGMDKSVTVKGKKINFITPSGTYVAQEKHKVKQMSSATYGLPTDYDLGYDKAIPLAVRLSGSGIFIHSAPWSVADQGVRNVSHGCININPEAAKWFYKTFGFGDIVQVTGTTTQLKPTDGFGDWNIPWDEWLQGSALR